MNRRRSITFQIKAVLPFMFAALTLPVAAQQPVGVERVLAVKAAVEASQASLRRYEWIETTVVSIKGEEKSRKQQRCFYGTDGRVQKIEIGATPPPGEKRGLRGRIAANIKEDISDYMRKALALVDAYAPPEPRMLQAAKDAGKVSMDVLGGNRARFNFRDYMKPGDSLGVEVDTTTNRPLGLTVATYLEHEEEAVKLNVRMGELSDGTVYVSSVSLESGPRYPTINVENSGYRRL